MNNIAIVTDTTADISKDLAKDNSVTVIPLYACYKGKLYKEGKEIKTYKNKYSGRGLIRIFNKKQKARRINMIVILKQLEKFREKDL